MMNEPFTTEVVPGRYPITLCHCKSYIETDIYKDVALAVLKFSDELPLKWEMAVKPGQDASVLKDDEMCYYPVDGASGCFGDAEAAQKADDMEERFTEIALAAFSQSDSEGRSRVNILLDEATGLNVIGFSLGGDGRFPSYFGYDESNKLVCLVTDFAAFDPDDSE